MNHRIRSAHKSDIVAMADISMRVHRSSVYETLIPQDQRQRFSEYYSDNKQARERLQQKLTAQLDMKGVRFLVAEHNGRVIGYVGVCLKSDELAIMKSLFVDIEQQGRGRLVESSYRECRASRG